MTSPLAAVAQSQLARNIASLYGVHLVNYLLPLVTVGYLSRILGPEGWGELAFAQGIALCIATFVEYGFNLSATREVARHRDDRERMRSLLAGVFGAKLLLGAVAAVATCALWPFLPLLHGKPELASISVLWGVAQGSTALWFLQGYERLGKISIFDIAVKIGVVICICLLVRSRQDIWLVLSLYAAGSMIATAVSVTFAVKEVGFSMPLWSNIWHALCLGWSMFLYRGSATLYTTANIFVLGLMASPQVVGYYAGAEKIGRSPVSLLWPFSVALYPRIASVAHRSRQSTQRLEHLSLAVLGSAGVLMGLALYFCAPLLVRLLLGPSFAPAVPTLQVLAALCPLVAINIFIGMHCLMPAGLDRPLIIVTFVSGLASLLLAALLAPRFGSVGMAWAVTSAEVFVLIGLYSTYVRARSRQAAVAGHSAPAAGHSSDHSAEAAATVIHI
jgi:polysaccharide transporter, PST family